MIKQKYILVLLLSILSNAAFSQDLNGKWNASMAGPQGAMYMVFDFMVDGDALSGSMSSDMMGISEITEGMVNGDEFSFNISMQGGPGGAMTLGFTGKLENDALNMSMEMPEMPGAGAGPGGPPAGGMPIAAIRAE